MSSTSLTPGQAHSVSCRGWAPRIVRRGRLMLRAIAILLLVGGVLLSVASPFSAAAADPTVAVIALDGTIDALSARQLARGIAKATEEGAELLVITLDTPGGLYSSTRDIVGAILSAEVPIVVFVSPSGAQATSAGTFIAASASFAAMAAGTTIGAASPVRPGGEDLPPTLAKKINEDSRAFIRGIAEQRGRNAAALEETVTKARSYSASEAVTLDIVDFVADDMADLLTELDGRSATTAAGEVVLRTHNTEIRAIEPTLLNSFLGVLANPNLAFLLFVLGGVGLLVEAVIPGFIGPGVIGGLALALSLLGFGHLPVNWVAVGILLCAPVLFYLETIEPGVSIFGIGGVVCLALGGLLLFGGFFSTSDIPEPSFMVNPWLIGALAGSAAIAGLAFVRLVRTEGGTASGYISASEAALEGEWGVAASDLAPAGKVWVDSQEWTATADTNDPIRAGEEVKVIGVYGDILKVERP